MGLEKKLVEPVQQIRFGKVLHYLGASWDIMDAVNEIPADGRAMTFLERADFLHFLAYFAYARMQVPNAARLQDLTSRDGLQGMVARAERRSHPYAAEMRTIYSDLSGQS